MSLFLEKNGDEISIRHVDYSSVSEARREFRTVLDSAERGKVVTINRNATVSAVVPAERLRSHLSKSVTPRTKVFMENNHWVVLLEELPFVSEGTNVDDAIEDIILQLREYAEDWDARLRFAPNHEQNWALVQLVNLSSDTQLADWLERGGDPR